MNINTQQLTLSYELLHLLHWLVINEQKTLKKIITRALSNGLLSNITQLKNKELFHQNNKNCAKVTDDIQYSIVDFLALLETLLDESYTEQNKKIMIEHKLMPAIDHLDSSILDSATVQFSIAKTTSKLAAEPHQNPQELLYQELLKCWKPSKKTMIN